MYIHSDIYLKVVREEIQEVKDKIDDTYDDKKKSLLEYRLSILEERLEISLNENQAQENSQSSD